MNNGLPNIPFEGTLYLTKFNLIKAAKIAEQNGYNRQLTTETLGSIADFNYVVYRVLAHFFKRGERSEEHRRLAVMLPVNKDAIALALSGDYSGFCPHFVDTSIAFFETICEQCGVKILDKEPTI